MIITETGIKFKSLEEEIYKYVCAEGVKLLEYMIYQLDGKLLLNRDTKKYRNKGYRTSSIKTIMGELNYTRRVYMYEDESGKQSSHYLLDEVLELDGGVGKISENLCEKIVELVCELPYRKASETLRELSCQPLSHMSLWNVTQSIGSRVVAEEDRCTSRARVSTGSGEVISKLLFEEQDGIHLPLQGESRKKHGKHGELKVSIAYRGWEQTGKDRYNTVGKVGYAGFDSPSAFYAGKEGVIADYYDVDEIEMRILNGDGASWIKRSLIDEDTHYQLDAYHRNQAIKRYVSDGDRRRELRELLYDNKIDDLLRTVQSYVEESAVSAERQTEHDGYTKLLSYYSNNKGGLIPYAQRGLRLPPATGDMVYRNLGTMESNIFSLIGFRMKGRRASWSISGGNHLAKLLVLKGTGRLTQMLKKIGQPHLPDKCEQQITTPLSAAKVPKKVGNGWNGYVQASIPGTLRWLKEFCKMRPPFEI
jgi:hypothetical protein